MKAQGFTLIEMLLGASIMSIVLIALIGAYLGQTALNMHARNLTLAMTDATRVMEAIRQQNMGEGCATRSYPVAIPPPYGDPADTTPTWDEWLEVTAANQGGGGKSIGPTPAHERVAVTCQDGSGATANYCGPQQMVDGYRQAAANLPHYDPIRITVAIGWREKNRVIGNSGAGQAEFQFSRLQAPLRWLARADEWFMPAAYAGGGGGGGRGGGGGGVIGPAPSVGWSMQDLDGNGVIDSQAMLTTLVTCR